MFYPSYTIFVVFFIFFCMCFFVVYLYRLRSWFYHFVFTFVIISPICVCVCVFLCGCECVLVIIFNLFALLFHLLSNLLPKENLSLNLGNIKKCTLITVFFCLLSYILTLHSHNFTFSLSLSLFRSLTLCPVVKLAITSCD